MSNFLLRSKVVCPNYDYDYPEITHGKGSLLFDRTNKSYIDASSGSCAVSIFGHGNQDLIDDISQQMSQVAVLPAHCMKSNIVENFAKLLCEYSGFGRKAWTCSSGSEAVENAMKCAIQYHHIRNDKQRYKVLGRNGSYHGNTLFDLDVGGMPLRKSNFEPLLNNFSQACSSYCYRCPYAKNPETCNVECADSLRKAIEIEKPETIAAFIAEPVVGAALGGVEADPRYFQRIREICNEYGILFIADEVMTGMARTGTDFAMEQWGVEPDITVLGKGLGGGYFPLSAIIINERVASEFENSKEPFWGGHTHACSPISAAVGQSVLEYITTNNIAHQTKEKGDYLLKCLEPLNNSPIVGDVRGKGLLVGIEFVKCKLAKTPFEDHHELSARIAKNLLNKGVIIYPGKGSYDGLLGDHLLITPPLTITYQELQHVAESICEVIEEVQE